MKKIFFIFLSLIFNSCAKIRLPSRAAIGKGAFKAIETTKEWTLKQLTQPMAYILLTIIAYKLIDSSIDNLYNNNEKKKGTQSYLKLENEQSDTSPKDPMDDFRRPVRPDAPPIESPPKNEVQPPTRKEPPAKNHSNSADNVLVWKGEPFIFDVDDETADNFRNLLGVILFSPKNKENGNKREKVAVTATFAMKEPEMSQNGTRIVITPIFDSLLPKDIQEGEYALSFVSLAPQNREILQFKALLFKFDKRDLPYFIEHNQRVHPIKGSKRKNVDSVIMEAGTKKEDPNLQPVEFRKAKVLEMQGSFT